VPDLTASIPNPIPFLPPLATMFMTGVTLEVTSPPFPIAAGAFSTMATATLLSGTATVTALGSTTVVPLAGEMSSPQPVAGTLVSTPTGFALSAALNVTFAFADPSTGASGNLTLTGTLVADHQPLNSDTQAISVATGGVQALYLSTGGAFGSNLYQVLGSASGTSPGIPVGGFTLPLNPDPLFFLSLNFPNQGLLGNTFGTLDANGKATATITIPPLPPSAAGQTFHMAYAVANASFIIQMVSNPFSLTLIP
jgi:hypothetical protein